MKLGKAALEALQAEVTGRLNPGDELVVVGAIGISGIVQITEKKYQSLSDRFSCHFLQNTLRFAKWYEDKGIVEEIWNLAQEAGATSLYQLGQGGFLSGLWKIAEASQVGLHVDLRKVPVYQETIEISEIFDINPYKLSSEGALLLGIQGGEAFVQEMRRRGYPAGVIGQTNSENDRLLYSGENVRYLERPGKDELLKVL